MSKWVWQVDHAMISNAPRTFFSPNQLVEFFFSIVGHWFRNPKNGMFGMEYQGRNLLLHYLRHPRYLEENLVSIDMIHLLHEFQEFLVNFRQREKPSFPGGQR